jgi:hypothetical protein
VLRHNGVVFRLISAKTLQHSDTNQF